MHSRIFGIAAALLLTLAGLPACEKSEAETAAEAAADRIATWVAAQLAANEDWREVDNGGVVRLVTVSGSGEALGRGGTVTFGYAGYNFASATISTSTLFVTNISDVATEAGWALTDADMEPASVVLGHDHLLKGLELGLEGVQAGEECVILFTGQEGFGKRGYGTIPANTALAFRIVVESVQN